MFSLDACSSQLGSVGLTYCKMCLTGLNNKNVFHFTRPSFFSPFCCFCFLSCAGCIWTWMMLHYTVNWEILRMSQLTSLLEDELFLFLFLFRWLKDKVLFKCLKIFWLNAVSPLHPTAFFFYHSYSMTVLVFSFVLFLFVFIFAAAAH